MITISVENVHDIVVDAALTKVTISFRDRRGSDADIEMSRLDAEFLLKRLREALGKIGESKELE